MHWKYCEIKNLFCGFKPELKKKTSSFSLIFQKVDFYYSFLIQVVRLKFFDCNYSEIFYCREHKTPGNGVYWVEVFSLTAACRDPDEWEELCLCAAIYLLCNNVRQLFREVLFIILECNLSLYFIFIFMTKRVLYFYGVNNK